jgi:hypothetical protein
MTFAPSAHHHSGDPRQPDSAGRICVNDESVPSSGCRIKIGGEINICTEFLLLLMGLFSNAISNS